MYFAKITSYSNSKNRLQEYLGKQLRQLECLTVEDPQAFGKHIEQLVHRANYKFPRCTSLTAYLHKAHTEGDYTGGVSEVVQFHLYAERGAFQGLQDHVPVTPNEGIQAALFSR